MPREELQLAELTALELLLLLCIKKLGDKELPPPHTLKMAQREYMVFLTSADDHRKYDYPNPLLVASFEHLTSLGLVVAQREGRHKSFPTEQLPLRLGIDAQSVYDYLKTHTELPLAIQRFGLTATL